MKAVLRRSDKYMSILFISQGKVINKNNNTLINYYLSECYNVNNF